MNEQLSKLRILFSKISHVLLLKLFQGAHEFLSATTCACDATKVLDDRRGHTLISSAGRATDTNVLRVPPVVGS
jgi:hypothetical protein